MPNRSAKAELIDGAADLLAKWERGDDLIGEGAEKIVSWLLRHERLIEAVQEGERSSRQTLRLDHRPS